MVAAAPARVRGPARSPTQSPLPPARAADWTTEQMQAEAEEGWAEDWDDVRGGHGARGWGAARRSAALSPSRARAGRVGGAARRGSDPTSPPRRPPQEDADTDFDKVLRAELAKVAAAGAAAAT